MNSKKLWEKPQLVTHDTVVRLTATGDLKSGSGIDFVTKILDLLGDDDPPVGELPW